MASSNLGGGGGGSSQSESPPPPPPSATHSSDKNTDPTSPPTPPSATNYPIHPPPGPAYPLPYGAYNHPPAGYQNPHAYPQGYAAYTDGYPTGYHNHPPAAPYYGPPPTYSTSGATVSAGNRFLRSFVLCCCAILTFIFLGSIIMALMLRPELPVYRVMSMSVANFTTTPALSGEWGTKMSIENPNVKLKAYFSDFRVDVIYKDSVVAVNYARGFALNTKEVREMEVKGLTTQTNESVLEKTTRDDMEKDRAMGFVTFALRVASINAFQSGSLSTRTTEVVAICEDLKIVFQNNSSTGTFDNGGRPVLCQLYV